MADWTNFSNVYGSRKGIRQYGGAGSIHDASAVRRAPLLDANGLPEIGVCWHELVDSAGRMPALSLMRVRRKTKI
jgi:hypothetical protein